MICGDVLKTSFYEFWPVVEGSYHQLTVDIVKFTAECPLLLQVDCFKLKIGRNTLIYKPVSYLN